MYIEAEDIYNSIKSAILGGTDIDEMDEYITVCIVNLINNFNKKKKATDKLDGETPIVDNEEISYSDLFRVEYEDDIAGYYDLITKKIDE